MCAAVRQSTLRAGLQKSRLRKHPFHLGTHFRKTGSQNFGIADREGATVRPQRDLLQTKRLPQSALDAVSLHGVARAARSCKCEGEFAQILVAEINHIKPFAPHKSPFAENSFDGPLTAQDFVLGQKAALLLTSRH